MKEILEILAKKLIGKIFPEFSNKVTWSLIAVGLSILSWPTPTYILFLNLIIDLLNKTTGSSINLIDIGNITPSNTIAVILIISGLVYHLAIKALQLYPEVIIENNKKEEQNRKRDADIELYKNFMSLLPPTSLIIEFLKNHNFGATFHQNSVEGFDKLRYSWGHADQHFHNQELETKATNFYNQMLAFDEFLSCNTNHIGNTPYSNMLSHKDTDMNWTDETEAKVKKANEWSSEIHALYNDFVITCKNTLAV
ncbi:hypothetical protein [Citrobacter sp. Igbk 17]|uniref:hypothetical protein n=1 Tax=Citrobacter sp. Igbk 17 TaxID=2963957 RepID=UPI002304448A|nr:hypothetical protein [Citrobacter sp. Igbk 17]MDA8497959.1 hypothetical protein [Citrobacter sp. Igbk 17]